MAAFANAQAEQQSFTKPLENELNVSSEGVKASRGSHELINII